jgi:hypothetical protein
LFIPDVTFNLLLLLLLLLLRLLLLLIFFFFFFPFFFFFFFFFFVFLLQALISYFVCYNFVFFITILASSSFPVYFHISSFIFTPPPACHLPKTHFSQTLATALRDLNSISCNPPNLTHKEIIAVNSMSLTQGNAIPVLSLYAFIARHREKLAFFPREEENTFSFKTCRTVLRPNQHSV